MTFPELNLPMHPLRRKSDESGELVFDEFRHRWVRLTPEEWVRQQFLAYLHRVLHYPITAIAVEKTLSFNRLRRRPDAVITGRNGEPLMVLEFKEPGVVIDEKVLFQAATYTSVIGNRYVLISNGLKHFVWRIDRAGNCLRSLDVIPDYAAILDEM